jgi:hypothetical protein
MLGIWSNIASRPWAMSRGHINPAGRDPRHPPCDRGQFAAMAGRCTCGFHGIHARRVSREVWRAGGRHDLRFHHLACCRGRMGLVRAVIGARARELAAAARGQRGGRRKSAARVGAGPCTIGDTQKASDWPREVRYAARSEAKVTKLGMGGNQARMNKQYSGQSWRLPWRN